MSSRRRPSPAPFILVVAVLAAAGTPDTLVAQAGDDEPRVVQMDVRPVLQNAADAERFLDRFYPPLLEEAGVEGVVGVWIRIDELGRVRETRLQETSGYVALDEAAEKVASLMSFQPAQRNGAPIAVWIPMDINFRLSDDGGEEPAAPDPVAPEAAAPESEARPGSESVPAKGPKPAPLQGVDPAPDPVPPADPDLADEPTFTPMTVRPELQNQEEIAAALEARYPPILRDTGIGGRVAVWIFIDEAGAVQNVRVHESSGYDAFDEAALAVARMMRFAPARNRGTPVPVWVTTTLNFEVGGGGGGR